MITKISTSSWTSTFTGVSNILSILFEGYSSELVVRPPDGKVEKNSIEELPGARVPAEITRFIKQNSNE